MAIRRYGPTLELSEPNRFVRAPVDKELVHRKDDYLITTFYSGDKISWINYSRQPLKRLQPLEITTFLNANKEEYVWIPDGNGGYIRKDGLAYARIETVPVEDAEVPVSVSVFSLEYFDRNGAFRKDVRAKLSSGLNTETLKDF